MYLTFDLEEWTLPQDYGIESRFNKNTGFSRQGLLALLEILDANNIKATFFTTGFWAEKNKDLMPRLSGHEIASHSYENKDHSRLSKKELTEEIKKSISILSEFSQIKGFRSPGFKINPHLKPVLKGLGFLYDSSHHPALVPGHYNNMNMPLKIFNQEIIEIPVSVIPVIRFPVSWVWMRNIGNILPHTAAILNKNMVIYIHPWEFATLPKIKGLPSYITRKCGKPFLKQFERFIKHYKELGTMEELARCSSNYSH